ncbi:MAG: hypothetical protein GX801_02620 [Fibrobacter sp.]|nr:hypothetical protein [Fibrobacter sp.]
MKPLNILICPLDWGLGHATRCAPIIKELLKQEHKVLIAVADSKQKRFFQGEFPKVQQIKIPAYSIKYPQKSWQMPFWIFKEIPRLLSIKKRENKFIEKIVTLEDIDVIISDNRFGCFNKKTLNIYITHQILISFPRIWRFFESWGAKFHAYLYRGFDQVWIPDYPKYPGLAAKLSHAPCPLPTQWLGALSRLKPYAKENSSEEKIEILAIISGPEPQRTNFEEFALKYANRWRNKSIIVRGLPNLPAKVTRQGVAEIHNHASAKQLSRWIKQANKIICRSGYSTIMDLAHFNKEVEWYPTLGQTEQEYLAEIHQEPLKSLSLKEHPTNLLEECIASLPDLFSQRKPTYE